MDRKKPRPRKDLVIFYQPNGSPASATWLFEHVFGKDARGWMVAFSGRQARLEDDEAPHNELVDTRQKSFRYPQEAEAAVTYLLKKAESSRDAYFGVHLFRERGNRLASNAVGAISCLWMDEDEGCYPDEGPEPTAIIHSSDKRRHLYWQLVHPVSAEWVVAMNRRIATWAGGDIGKAGLATVLRPPATLNFKRYPNVDPVRLEITGVPPWGPEIMEQAIPPLPEPSRPDHRHPYNGPDVELGDCLAAVEVRYEVPDELSGTKYSIVCPWVNQHSGGDRTGTYIGKRIGGGPWFFCHHEHCRHRGWGDFKRIVRPKGIKVFSTHTEVILYE